MAPEVASAKSNQQGEFIPPSQHYTFRQKEMCPYSDKGIIHVRLPGPNYIPHILTNCLLTV